MAPVLIKANKVVGSGWLFGPTDHKSVYTFADYISDPGQKESLQMLAEYFTELMPEVSAAETELKLEAHSRYYTKLVKEEIEAAFQRFKGEAALIPEFNYQPFIEAIIRDVVIPRKTAPAISVQLVRKIEAETGIVSIGIPKEYGGSGTEGGFKLVTAIGIATGIIPSLATVIWAHRGIGTSPILYCGTKEQRERWLRLIAELLVLSSFALSEPHAGSDTAHLLKKAHRDGDHWALNGRTQFTSNPGFGRWPDTKTVAIVLALVDGYMPAMFIVPLDAPGVTLEREENKMGMWGSSTCSIVMENVRVPADHLIGGEAMIDHGLKNFFKTLNLGRNALAVGTAGGTLGVLAYALHYASERTVQYKKPKPYPIRNQGAVRRHLADIALLAYLGTAMVFRSAGLFDDALQGLSGDEKLDNTLDAVSLYTGECSLNKVWCSEAYSRATELGVQIMGGNGYILDYPMAGWRRDQDVQKIWEGTNEINRDVFVGDLLNKIKDGELPPLPGIPDDATFRKIDALPILDRAKFVFRMLLNQAIAELGDGFYGDHQFGQMLRMEFANMAADLFAWDSGQARYFKHPYELGDELAGLFYELAQMTLLESVRSRALEIADNLELNRVRVKRLVGELLVREDRRKETMTRKKFRITQILYEAWDKREAWLRDWLVFDGSKMKLSD